MAGGPSSSPLSDLPVADSVRSVYAYLGAIHKGRPQKYLVPYPIPHVPFVHMSYPYPILDVRI